MHGPQTIARALVLEAPELYTYCFDSWRGYRWTESSCTAVVVTSRPPVSALVYVDYLVLSVVQWLVHRSSWCFF